MSKRRFGFTTLVMALLFVSAYLLGTAAASSRVNILQSALDDTPAPIVQSENEQALEGIYNGVSPSVVSINVVARRETRRAFGDVVSGTGSGFVVDTEGHIVTNNHVVDGATSIEVNFYDGTLARAEVVGVDADSDLAVIKVDLAADRLHPVTFADSDEVQIGQTTLAIGSPFGERWTLTSGIVSALDRTITGLNQYTIGGVIQTDASINPGNSGGPLLNLQGHVIGVNSQILSESGSSSGVGFAVPSKLVQRVASELIADGSVDYSYIGVSGSDMSLTVIEALNLPNNTRGVVVGQVVPNGPAASAGLRDAQAQRQGNGQLLPTSVDIITAIDGEAITGMGELVAYLANDTTPGQTIILSLLRDGQAIELPVTLTSRPDAALQ